MKLKKLVDVCMNTDTPVKIILHTFYFNGGCEDERDEELTLYSFIQFKNRNVNYYEFTCNDKDERICYVDLEE